MAFFTEIEKIYSIYVEPQKTRRRHINPEKNTKLELLDFKISYKVSVIKAM